MIYIVTVSCGYYPEGGVGDWVFVTKDFDKACHRAQADVGPYTTAFVVRIDPSTLYYDVIREYTETGERVESRATR